MLKVLVLIVSFAMSGCGCINYLVELNRDPGLLKVCWVGGRAKYSCGDTKLVWNKSSLPLRYYVTGSDNKDLLDSIKGAAKLWNDLLGFEAFVVTGDIKAANVLIGQDFDDGLTGEDDSTAATGHRGDGVATSSYIKLNRIHGLTVGELYLVVAHEFGHVLGLDHDPYPNSLMSPVLEKEDVTDPNNPLTRKRGKKWILPMDSDIEILRKLYQ
jgi:hypothetical protein